MCASFFLDPMRTTHLLLVVAAVLAGVLAVRIHRESPPQGRTQPIGKAILPALPQPTNAPPETFVEVYPTPPPPPPPVVLPKRQPGRQLNPTREEVQAIMARLRRGPDQEPEFSKLHAQLMTLDYRDYPEEYATIIGDRGWLNYIWADRIREFHANDDPEFLQAVLTYFHREQPRLRPPSRYFDFIDFFAHMTNSPALAPPLIKGLESPDYRAVSATAFALSLLPSPESAKALVEHAKQHGPPPANLPEDAAQTFVHQEVARLRNPALIPYFEEQLAATKDESLRLHLKFAILASRENLPAFPTDEAWKAMWKKVEAWK